MRSRSARSGVALAPLPRAAAAAPSPCPSLEGKFLVLGGDDGKLAGKVEPLKHPGFTKEVLGYDPAADAWDLPRRGLLCPGHHRLRQVEQRFCGRQRRDPPLHPFDRRLVGARGVRLGWRKCPAGP